MFNSKRESKPKHFLDVFNILNDVQKESIVSLLIVLAGSDQEITEGINEEEFSYINNHIEHFNLKKSFTILEDVGINGVLYILKDLSKIQKKHLIAISYGLLISDDEPNDIEILMMNKFLNEIGITSKEIMETVKLIN